MCLAIPGRIEKIDAEERSWLRQADVSFQGIIKKINISFLDQPEVGQYVIVHAGVAIQTLDEAEAVETLKSFGVLGDGDSE